MVFSFLINRPKAYENFVLIPSKLITHVYINLFTHNNFKDFTDD